MADSLTNNSLEEYLTNFFEDAFVWANNESINLTINYIDTYVSERLNFLYANLKKSNKQENEKDNEEIKNLLKDLEIKFEVKSVSDACVIAKKISEFFSLHNKKHLMINLWEQGEAPIQARIRVSNTEGSIKVAGQIITSELTHEINKVRDGGQVLK